MLSVVSGLFVLLVLGAVGIGVGTAASLQARFAAVDLADAEHRGRALSAVVWAVTVGAVAGPNLIQPGTVVGLALGLPPVAGPFVISAAGLLLAIVLVFAGLRPDPLLLAREIAARDLAAQDLATQEPAALDLDARPAGGKMQDTLPRTANQQGATARNPVGGSLVRGLRAIRQSRASWLALAAVVGAHAVMVGVMSMTPLHLQELVAGLVRPMPATPPPAMSW
ncbi:uncharacterized MFS-type transporter YdeG [Arthrobacter sp. Hiyo4]|nr:uncharacterized MFS-type transporter YdeG [Arthrobacter sp. Hiyo4]